MPNRVIPTGEPYGRRGKNNPMPSTYDPDTELVIIRNASIIACGRWISTYKFILGGGSYTLARDKRHDVSTKKIIEQLVEKSKMEYDGGGGFNLFEDIILYSPSAAGKLILGQQSNGYVDWKNRDGIMLGHLAWPDNPAYK